jgi:hypothetical protein
MVLSDGLFALWRARRLTARKIGEAREGDVHLAGRVLSQGALLEAPFSRRACVLHDVLVEETILWFGIRKIARALCGSTFSLDDGTGTVDVVLHESEEPVLVTGPRHVTSVIYRDVWTSSFLGLGSDVYTRASRIEGFLFEHGVDATSLNGGVRASEGIIEVGDHISPATKYVIRPSEQAPLTIIKARGARWAEELEAP